MLIKKGLVFTENGKFEEKSVLTQGEEITMLLPGDALIKYQGEVVDASECYVLPGFVDIHFHGCAGYDFCEGSAETIEQMAKYEFSQGVTGICPATMTLREEKISGLMRQVSAYKKQEKKGKNARLLGVHLEGPFINPAKKGAQSEADIQSPEIEKLRRWQEAAGGLIRLVTIAPEMEGAIRCIGEGKREFHFSLGHCSCDYDMARKAFEAGADHVTHLFNAMPSLEHRNPGLIGAAFDHKECFVELICDGTHIAPSVVRMVFRLFGEERVVLISDSMEATGMPDGEYHLGGQRVSVRKKTAALEDGTLAGSVTSLYGCFREAVRMGIPIESAIKACTVNPCKSIGLDKEYGSLAVGKKACFLLLDQKTLEICNVIAGQEIL